MDATFIPSHGYAIFWTSIVITEICEYDYIATMKSKKCKNPEHDNEWWNHSLESIVEYIMITVIAGSHSILTWPAMILHTGHFMVLSA